LRRPRLELLELDNPWLEESGPAVARVQKTFCGVLEPSRAMRYFAWSEVSRPGMSRTVMRLRRTLCNSFRFCDSHFLPLRFSERRYLGITHLAKTPSRHRSWFFPRIYTYLACGMLPGRSKEPLLPLFPPSLGPLAKETTSMLTSRRNNPFGLISLVKPACPDESC
jgi:hypothetical protein